MFKFIGCVALSIAPGAAYADASGGAATTSGEQGIAPAVKSQPSSSELKTKTGGELAIGVSSYGYRELSSTAPAAELMALRGMKIGLEYTQTIALGRGLGWFGAVNVRGTYGDTRYSTPQGFNINLSNDPTSASGYSGILTPAAGFSKPGIADWYVEGRAMIGKDLVGRAVVASPYAGIGFRHLSNGKSNFSAFDSAGFRKQDYLYLPVGVTLKTGRFLSRWLSSTEFNVEGDLLLRGWQKTANSRLPAFTAPAAANSPAFSFFGANDLGFEQRQGYAVRVSAKLRLDRHWSVEPFFLHWGIARSSTDFGTFRYAINDQPAQVTIPFVEPRNHTDEFGLKIGFRF